MHSLTFFSTYLLWLTRAAGIIAVYHRVHTYTQRPIYAHDRYPKQQISDFNWTDCMFLDPGKKQEDLKIINKDME